MNKFIFSSSYKKVKSHKLAEFILSNCLHLEKF